MCFYTDRNLHGFIFNQFILVPMLWKYEASPCSDAFSLRTLFRDLWPVRSMVSCSGTPAWCSAELLLSGLKKLGWRTTVLLEWLEKNPGIFQLYRTYFSLVDSNWLYNETDFIVSLWAKTSFWTCKIPCVALMHVTYTIGYSQKDEGGSKITRRCASSWHFSPSCT